MPTLGIFNHVTIDGYIADKQGDMSWAHKNDEEWNAFVQGNASGRDGGAFLFGRVTYDIMASFWPTPAAAESMPVVATAMNEAPKVVFSRTMKEAGWSNTRVVSGDIVAEVRAMKKAPGRNMLIFGSGSIVAQLAEAGLIDTYQIIFNPLALGGGRPMFSSRVPLKRTETRAFQNGNVLLTYVPA